MTSKGPQRIFTDFEKEESAFVWRYSLLSYAEIRKRYGLGSRNFSTLINSADRVSKKDMPSAEHLQDEYNKIVNRYYNMSAELEAILMKFHKTYIDPTGNTPSASTLAQECVDYMFTEGKSDECYAMIRLIADMCDNSPTMSMVDAISYHQIISGKSELREKILSCIDI